MAAQKPADILFLVSAAFSFAAAAFFPALVLGIFWKRANKWGASLGMMAGLGITFYYMVTTQPWLRGVFGVTSAGATLWFGIPPISAGVFGVPLGFAVIIIVSLLTPAPSRASAGAGRARALPEPEAGGLTAPKPAAAGLGLPEGVCERAVPASTLASAILMGFSLAAPARRPGVEDASGRLPIVGIHKECSCVITRSFC